MSVAIYQKDGVSVVKSVLSECFLLHIVQKCY